MMNDALLVLCGCTLVLVIAAGVFELINKPGVKTWTGKGRRRGR